MIKAIVVTVKTGVFMGTLDQLLVVSAEGFPDGYMQRDYSLSWGEEAANALDMWASTNGVKVESPFAHYPMQAMATYEAE